MYIPKQGDIVYMDFHPQSGHEQTGRRPGIIVSNDDFYLKTKLALVCPITNTNNKFPLHLPLDKRNKITGMILCEHVKSLDVVSRNAEFVEKLPNDLLKKVILYIEAFL